MPVNGGKTPTAKTKKRPAPYRTPPPSSSQRNDPPASDVTLRALSPMLSGSDTEGAPRMLARELTTAKGRRKAKPQDDDNPRTRILKLARFVRRGVEPFDHVPQAINVGNASKTLKLYENLPTTDARYKEEEKQLAENIVRNCGEGAERLIKMHASLMALFSDYEDYIRKLPGDEQDDLWYMIGHKADNARAYDTNKLKTGAFDFVLEEGWPSPALLKSKMNHGTNHPQLARMIVPMSILHKYGKDPKFEDLAKAGKFKITHRSLPAFLFDVKAYHSRFPRKSLLRGYFPVLVCKHIFIGPGSVKRDAGRKGRATRPGNAKLAGQTEVTPEMIAYSCIQARFFLSCQEVWGDDDEKGFDLKAFYYVILALFRKTDAKWVKETLAWWNEQIFGPRQVIPAEDEDEDEDDETSYVKMLAAIENDEGEDDDNGDEQDELESGDDTSEDEYDDDGNNKDNNSKLYSNSSNNGADTQARPSQTQPDSQYEQDAFAQLM